MVTAEGFLDVAGAILDGTPVDWPSVRFRADERDLPLVDQLHALAGLAALHRDPRTGGRDANHTSQATLGPRSAQLESWGHLRVFAVIGRGAFGEVYRAWDTRLDREVALKLLPANFRAAPQATSIIEEGRLLARVRHPNVVTIYGAERIEDRIGLWMELVRGRTLEQALMQGYTFAEDETIEIGIQICQAISAVHRASLLHRDVKAQNVMLTEDRRVVLMDFGTGLELTADPACRLAGTPLYMAPELFAAQAATVRSDIYSVGVLLYHLLTGSYPVYAENLQDLKAAHQRHERTVLRSARPGLSPKLVRLIERAIDPDPARRHGNAEALAADLEAIKNRRWNLPRVYATGAAVALLLVVAFGWEVRDHLRTLTRSGGSAANATRAGALTSIERPVIAVLPLQNLSAEPDSDYFADGLTDEIIRNLAIVEGLEVRSHTSSFAFKNKPRNVRDVGDQLGANLIVEGSVLRSGHKLRVNAQLVQIAGDVPLWSDRFDRELNDVFAIQDEISRAIVNRLRLTLGRGQRRYDTNLEAYELYLKARQMLDRREVGDDARAAEMFEEVVAKDSGFAPAYAGLVNARAFMSMSPYGGPSRSFEAAQAAMRPSAVKALQLDPLLAEAHAAMGWVYAREFDWNNADSSFKRAIELNPTLTWVYVNYSLSALRPTGRQDEADRLLHTALRADPLSLEVRREIVNVQLDNGQYDGAYATVQDLRARDANFPVPQLPRVLTLSGRPAEAIGLLEKLGPGAQQYLAYAYVKAGRRAEAERLAIANEGFPFRAAIIHAALGDKEGAFDALERMAVSEPQRLGLTLMFPELTELRGDPRYESLRKKLRLE